MSKAGELRVPVLPSGTRRRLVHGGFIAIALLYVGILVIAPLIGIAWAVFQAGWSTIVSTLRQPDVQHAFYLTGVITVITVIVTSIFGSGTRSVALLEEAERVLPPEDSSLRARTLARLATEHEATVMAGRSHNVAAQATTLGKRFATIADEVLVETAFGGKRVMDLLAGDPLPRIC